MAVLSPIMQSTPLMTESMILSLLDQCWYSQSILSHSIALYVLSVESETVLRSSETNGVDTTVSLDAECSTLQSIDDHLIIDQERTSNETDCDAVKESEFPKASDMVEKIPDGLISKEELPRANTGDYAGGQISGEELNTTNTGDGADGQISGEELNTTNTGDRADGQISGEELNRTNTNTGDHTDGLTSGGEAQRIDTGNHVGQAAQGKPVYTNYSVTGIPGDGRCLFRAVAHGSSLRYGNGALDDGQQRDLADELRNKAADELVKRRDETEWFIEDDFDMYVNRIRQPDVWGGETELLMLSHVLKMPITVYMADRNVKGGLIAICEYGQEYSTDNPVQVLYDGFGHYDAVQVRSEAVAPSKL